MRIFLDPTLLFGEKLVKANKQIITIVSLVLVLIVIVSLVSTFWPKSEKFFELGVLGHNKTAEDYFANNNFTITHGSSTNWFVYVHNNMGSAEQIAIKVKLLNSTMVQPNDSINTPSPYVSFEDLSASLSSNETVLLPFSWSLGTVSSQNGVSTIDSLIINNQTVNTNISTSDYFSMVFELWVYNQNSHSFLFGWSSGNTFSSASVNIDFRTA